MFRRVHYQVAGGASGEWGVDALYRAASGTRRGGSLGRVDAMEGTCASGGW